MSASPPLQMSDFDPVWYLGANADVRASGQDPWAHYSTIGYTEGRHGAPMQAFELEHMLWRGYADIALPVLDTLIVDGPAYEKAAAGWVLARWHLDRRSLESKDIERAYDAIETFHRYDNAASIIAHRGPALLAIHLCLATGRIDRAAWHLDRARTAHPPHADLDLAALTLDQATGGDAAALTAHLGSIYEQAGLAPIYFSEASGNTAQNTAKNAAQNTGLFDRLAPAVQPHSTLDQPYSSPPHSTQPYAARPYAAQPLVSIIMPVFNGASGINHALDGLCGQSWQNLEIIIVDDGSTDETVKIARNRAASDPRIQIIESDANHGAYPARNTGMAAATGDFITVHDADDWSHPHKTAAQVGPLLQDETLQGSLSHWVRVTDDFGMGLWRIDHGWVHRNVSSLMIRAGLRDTLGYWDRTRTNADTEYYYRILRAFGPACLHEVHPGVPLAFGRSTPQSLTMQSRTHLRTQYHGLRRDYMDAAFYWHQQAATPADLYVPCHPATRPFHIPQEIGVGDPQGADTPYDILTKSDLLDPKWYGIAHRDVLAADINPVRHYLEGGAREDRDTGPRFASGAYRIANNLPDDTIPLLHWHQTGKAAGANPLPAFDGALVDALQDAPADRPRVMVFAHAAGPTLFGAERSLLDVIERMVKRGLVPVVVLPVLRNRDYLTRLQAICARIEVLPQLPRNGWRTPDPETVAQARALIRRYAPTQVHVNTLVQDIPLVAARAEGVQSIVHIREMPHQDATLCRAFATTPERLRAQILEQADRFIINSPLLAEWLDAPERTDIRPNTVNPALFDLPYQPKKEITVALISSNILKKGVADFIRIARTVQAEGRPIRFLLIGPPTQDLHLLRPWPDNIDFRGYSATPLKAIAQADVVVNLSHFTESFGRTVMEAMAAARPVITYDRGTPAILVKSGVTGFVVPADDTACVANAVLALEAARGRMIAMGRAGQDRARALQALAEQAT